MNRELFTETQKQLIVTLGLKADCDHHGYRSSGAEEPITWCAGQPCLNYPNNVRSTSLEAGIVNDDRDACV
jgi:hypothetical protein